MGGRSCEYPPATGGLIHPCCPTPHSMPHRFKDCGPAYAPPAPATWVFEFAHVPVITARGLAILEEGMARFNEPGPHCRHVHRGATATHHGHPHRRARDQRPTFG